MSIPPLVIPVARVPDGQEVDPGPTPARTRAILWVLLLSGLSLTILLMLFGWTYVNVPTGWSPRLSEEGDVTALFPHWWVFPAFRQHPSDFALRAELLIGGLWTAYVFATGSVFRIQASGRVRGLRIVVIVAVVANLILVAMPPVVCGDLFHYALFGRMVSSYGFNPYVTPAIKIRLDPIWPYASWHSLTSHYGPGFTWLSAALTALSGGRVFWTAISFKAVMAIANLVSCWFIRDISVRLGKGDGLDALALYALNPLVLIETAGMGHNEALVVAYALAGVSLALRGHPWLAFALFLLSSDVKTVTASLALLFAVRFIVQAPDGRKRLYRLVGLLVSFILILGILWVPFWRGREMFDTSRAILATSDSNRTVNATQAGAFVVLVLACAAAASQGSMALLLNLTSAIGLTFVIFIFPWHFAWYGIPPLAFAVAAPRSRANTLLLAIAAAFGLVLTLRYLTLHPLLGATG
jgi:hypothetical protein